VQAELELELEQLAIRLQRYSVLQVKLPPSLHLLRHLLAKALHQTLILTL
jgi:hypothetical protein